MSGMSAARHISRMDFPTAISAQIRSTISAPYFDDPFGLAILSTAQQCDESITCAPATIRALRFSTLLEQER
jgi:hypothetical protein